jgi:hypothetical protein
LPGVGHARGHPVAEADTGGLQAVLKTGDMLGQFGPGQLFALAVFATATTATASSRRRSRCSASSGSRRETTGRWASAGLHQHRVGLVWKADIEEVDDGLPEATR